LPPWSTPHPGTQGQPVINEIVIKNYKSIEKITLPLGRVNVFIGENGAGKSNILEAVALAGAAGADKLDNEFLSSRGIRVTKPQLMRAGFAKDNETTPIEIQIKNASGSVHEFELTNDNAPYSKWERKHLPEKTHIDLGEFLKNFRGDKSNIGKNSVLSFLKIIRDSLEDTENHEISKNDRELSINIKLKIDETSPSHAIISDIIEADIGSDSDIGKFVIYSPENSSLRAFDKEGQIEPLGINGEGLFKLLKVFAAEEDKASFNSVREGLKLLGWYDDIELPDDGESGRSIVLKDKYICDGLKSFDQRSANEGFLLVAFYLALFSTKLTPPFFAIDNIDASLNPKLCETLIKKLYELSVENDKQAILTTHNPAILDGMNLDDDQQRLFVISRDISGLTQVRRISKPKSQEGEVPIRLSQLFIKGKLGGLPKRF
jgi:predicted ATPase